MKNNKLKIVASIISKVLHPLVFSLITLFFVINAFFSNNKDFISWSLITLFFLVIIPTGYILYSVRKGKITDMDILIREHRFKPFIIAIASAIIGTIILYCIGVEFSIIIFCIIYILNLSIILLITQFSKISLHTSVMTATIIALSSFFGRNFLWLLFLLPILIWSRVYRKRHTFKETIFGILVSAILTLLILNYFDYQFFL